MRNIDKVRKTIENIVDHNLKVSEGYLIKFGEKDALGNVFSKDCKINIPVRLKDKLKLDDKGLKFK